MELNDSVSSAELFGPTVTVGTMKDEQERDVDTDYQCWRDYYQVATLGQECWHFLTGLSLANLRPPGPALGSYWAGLGMWQGAHLVRLVMSAEIITVINIEIFWRLHCLSSAWHQVNINWNSVSAPSLWSNEDLLQVAKSATAPAGAEINLKFVSTPHSVPIKVWQYYRQTHHLVILRRKIKPNHDLELLSVLSYRSEISSLWESKKVFWWNCRHLNEWSCWFIKIWAQWQSRGLPRDLRLENWDVNYILHHLSSDLSSPSGANTATSQPIPEVSLSERETSSARRLWWTLRGLGLSHSLCGEVIDTLGMSYCIKYQLSRIKDKNQWRHAQADVQHLYLHTWALTGAGPDLITWITGRGESIREDIWR